MPKEIRNPKSEWRGTPDEPQRDDPAFWIWGDEAESEPMALREDATPDGMRPNDLMERTAQLGEAIVRFVRKIPRGPNHPENNRLVDQLVGAATSIGANYCEADDAVSGKDFKKSIGTLPQRVEGINVLSANGCGVRGEFAGRSPKAVERGEGTEPDLRRDLEEVMRNPKSEIGNPKETRDPKSEKAARGFLAHSGFGFRISFGFRPSDFGFQSILCS